MGNFGMGEWIVILVVVLIFFGPKNLPKLANSIGRSVRELKNGLSNLGEDIRNDPPAGEKPAATTQTKTAAAPASPVSPVETPVEHTEKQA